MKGCEWARNGHWVHLLAPWKVGDHLDVPMILLFTTVTFKQDTKKCRNPMLFSLTQNFQWWREIWVTLIDFILLCSRIMYKVQSPGIRSALLLLKAIFYCVWWRRFLMWSRILALNLGSPCNSAVLVKSPKASFLKSLSNMYRRHSCSLLRKLFLEVRSSHFWKIMVAADPKSWPWTPANVFLTPKCPAKTK